MELMVRLSPEQEQQLRDEARRLGLGIEETVQRLLGQRLPPQRNAAARALLREFDAEDETDDPLEIAARRAEWEELKAALNANHTSDRVLFPELGR
jgi:hypothetical protein